MSTRAAHIDTAELTTARLRLRRYGHTDLASFIAFMRDREVSRYVAGGAMEPAEAAALFERVFTVYAERRFAVWAVEQPGSGYIGHAELKPRSGEPGLELVYLLARQCWGAGLGTELASVLLQHALQDLRAPRVLATLHPDNERSRRILVRLGFHFVRAWQEPDDDVMTCLWASAARPG